MALDEPKEGDEVFEDDGLTYIVNRQLLDRVKPIRIEYIEGPGKPGFLVSGALPGAGTPGNSQG